MPITPYSTPIKTEYKPLGLEAFAQPLSKMQEYLDITKSAIDTAEFNVDHLPLGTDPERAKALIGEIEQVKNDLSKNLIGTKNYKQAATKLKELQNKWNNNPELQGLRQNYATRNELIKEQKERLNKGDISQTAYDQWLTRMDREFSEKGGTSYTPEGFNKFGRSGRLKNVEDDYEKDRREVAKLKPAEKRKWVARNIGTSVSPYEIEKITTELESLDGDELAKAVEKYMRNIPKYKEYFSEVADYNLDEIIANKGVENIAPTLLDIKISQFEQKELAYKNALSSKDQKARDAAKAYFESEYYSEEQAEKQRLLDQKQSGSFNMNDLKSIYTQQYLNQRYNQSDLGDLMEYTNKSTDKSFSFIPEWIANPSGSGSGDEENGGVAPIATADIYGNIDLKSFDQKRIAAGQAMYNILGGSKNNKGLHNVADGSWRNVINVKDTSPKNLGVMATKNKQLFTALNKANSLEDLKRYATQYGLNANSSDLSKIWKDWKAGGAVKTQIQQNVEQLDKLNKERQLAVSSKEHLDKQIQETPEFKTELSKLKFDTSPLSETAIDSKDAKDNLFNPLNYSKEELAKIGYKIPEYERVWGIGVKERPWKRALTWNEVAKLKGYKNAADAMNKGYTFDNAKQGFDDPLYKRYNDLKQNVLNKSKSIEQMDQVFIKNKAVNQTLQEMFPTINDVLKYDLLYNDWNSQPGFATRSDATGKKVGEPLPGTKIDYTKRTVQLGSSGGNPYIAVPYEYKDEDGNVRKGVLKTVPRAGSEPLMYNLYNKMDEATSTGEPVDQATNNVIKVMKFNAIYGNNINDTWNTIDITPGGKPITLDIIPSGKPNISIRLTKEQQKNELSPKVKIHVVNDINQSTLGTQEFTSPEDAKVYIMNLGL